MSQLKRTRAGRDRRRKYSGVQVWLNNKPAKISGFQLEFGRVTNGEQSYEWAWESIERIVGRDGKFYS